MCPSSSCRAATRLAIIGARFRRSPSHFVPRPGVQADLPILHPHSGIATLTYVAEGAVSYIDPDNVKGTLSAGGVEWMQAGRGM